jgi:hypothetical protein
MSNNEQHLAYDIEYSHIVREIKTPLSIYSSRNSTEDKMIKTDAIWDTGATHSVFSSKIVQELGLISVDKWTAGGINQVIKTDIVIATIILPNGFQLTEKRFAICDIPGTDVLIGMDIISMGDFVITNAKGKTMFSFVIPTLNNKISFTKMVNEGYTI